MLRPSSVFPFAALVTLAWIGYAGCVGSDPGPVAPSDDGGGRSDAAGDPDAASTDAAKPACDPDGTFTTIAAVDELNTAGLQNFGARLTRDGRTVYFHRALSTTDLEIYAASRPSRGAAFEDVRLVEGLATPPGMLDAFPTPSPDGSLLFFQRRSGTAAEAESDIWFASRAATGFTGATREPNLSVVGRQERTPYFGGDGSIWLSASDVGTDAGLSANSRILRSAKGPTGYAAPTPVNLETPPNAIDESPVISYDGKILYFSSTRDGASRIWIAKQGPTDAEFGVIAKVDQLNAAGDLNLPSSLADDHCELYFHRQEGGVFRIYRATR